MRRRSSLRRCSSHYGANHPEYRKAQAQLNQVDAAIEATRLQIADRVEIGYREAQRREAMVGDAVTAAKAEFDRMNARSFEYQAVKREADADKNLYEQLVRKIREAGINAGFQNGSIRIADCGAGGAEAGVSESGIECDAGVSAVDVGGGGGGGAERFAG